MSSYIEFTDLFLWGLLSVLVYYLVLHKSRRDKLLDVIPGPPRPPIIGHTLDFLFTPKKELFPMLIRWVDKYGPLVKTFSGNRRFVMITDPKYIEKVLTSTVHLKKGFDYDFIRPWLGDGLLLSQGILSKMYRDSYTGPKWSHQRKLLTPAFHFKILEEFLPVFNQESFKMARILRKKYSNGSTFDFVPYVTKCTLDIICETAMGKPINAQDGENLEYTQAVREFADVMQDRAFRPWLHNEFIWKKSSLYQKQQEQLRILHGFTDSVIKERKLERAQSSKKNDENTKKDAAQDKDDIYFGKAKKKKAFLDLLMDVQQEVGTAELSDEDLRNQTDTFMFAGHDTTSVAISFAIFALGAYPEIQSKVQEELKEVFGDDKERPVTAEDLTKLKYLECVIKETLRVYPSVPFIQRHLTSDLQLDETITIPADVTVAMFIYIVHKQPKYFPEPHVFNPERFSDGESRNPFAFIPFSAGPRNCVGQKFAMMEAKIILANVLRNFEVKSLTHPKDLVIQSEITIRSDNGIQISLSPK